MDKFGDVGGPIDQPDGTLHCAAHDLEICNHCCVDYTFQREIFGAGRPEVQLTEKRERDLKEPQAGSYIVPTQCIPGCSKKATLLCTGCKVKRYCGVTHQKSDWKDNHKTACTQLVHQFTASAKIRAVFTRAFTIAESYHPGPHPAYDELKPLTRYTITWQKDGRKGEEVFKWRGTEIPEHSLTPSSGPFAFYPLTSCSLAQRVDFMKTVKDDESVRRGGLHALANVRDQDTFYGMAINFVTHGTILPFSPCRCDYYDDGGGDDEREDKGEDEDKEITVLETRKMPKWWKDARDWWDPLFRRAQANPFDVSCMYDSSDKGCLVGSLCPFVHDTHNTPII